MKKLLFLVLILTAQSFAAQGGTSPADVTLVIQEIASGSGPITKVEYDKFWQQMGITSREAKEVVIDNMRQNFLMTQEYQKEIWSCAEQAWISRVVPKCERAAAKISGLKMVMKQNGQEGALSPIEQNSKNLLEAAAKRQPMKGASGVEVPLSLESIRAGKLATDTMLSRFERVLRVQF